MKILNTRKLEGPSEEDLELLRRLLQEAFTDPANVMIIKGTIEIDSDGNIILKKT